MKKTLLLLAAILVQSSVSADTGDQLWKKTLEANIGSSPSVDGGKVFIGSVDGMLYALDETTGNTVWFKDIGSHIAATPAISPDGTSLYVGTYDGRLLSIKTADGSVRWALGTGGAVYASPAISADGSRVYAGSNDDNIYSVDAVSGTEVWQYHTSGDVAGSLAVGMDGTVYAGSGDGKVYALNPADTLAGGTNRLKWAYEVQLMQGVASPVIGNNGKLYVGSHNKSLKAINSVTGSLVWTRDFDGKIAGSPAYFEGRIVVGDYDIGKLYCLDAATGEVLWSYNTGASFFSSPVVDNQGNIYQANGNGKLYIISKNGLLVETVTLDGGSYSSPALKNGKIFLSDKSGAAYAYEAVAITPTASAAASWSMFRNTLKRSGVVVDTDGDGMSDAWETANGLNPAANDASGNADGDGYTNLQEFQVGTSIALSDTDADGIQDDLDQNPLGITGSAVGYQAIVDRVVTKVSNPILIPGLVLQANDKNEDSINATINSVSDASAGYTVSASAGDISFSSTATGTGRFLYGITNSTSKGDVLVKIVGASGEVEGTSEDELLFGSTADDIFAWGVGSGADRIFSDDSRISKNDKVQLAGTDLRAVGNIELESDGADLKLFKSSSPDDSLKVTDVYLQSAGARKDKVNSIEDQNGVTTVFAVNDKIVLPAVTGDETISLGEELLFNDFSGSGNPVKPDYNQFSALSNVNPYFGLEYNNLFGFEWIALKPQNPSSEVNVAYVSNDGLNESEAKATVNWSSGTNISRPAAGQPGAVGEVIYGTGQADTVYAGGGLDFINAGEGANTIKFDNNSDQDVLIVTGGYDDYDDAEITDLRPADLEISRAGYDLIVKNKDNVKNQLIIQNLFLYDAAMPAGGTSYIKFDELKLTGTGKDGLPINTVLSNSIRSTAGSSNLERSINVTNYLQGGDTGGGANDKYTGTTPPAGSQPVSPDLFIGDGSGNDAILGWGGDDRIWGQAGSDALYGGPGQDLINGGAGNDVMYGDAGHDWLTPGAAVAPGYDFASGGAGRDYYVIQPATSTAYFNLVIDNLDLTTPDSCTTCLTNKDAVRFNPGIKQKTVEQTANPDNVIFQTNGNDLIVKVTTGTYVSTAKIINYFHGIENMDMDFTFKDIEYPTGTYPVIIDGTCSDYSIGSPPGGSWDENDVSMDTNDGTVAGGPDGVPDTARVRYSNTRSPAPACMRVQLVSHSITDGNDTVYGFGEDEWMRTKAGNDTVHAQNGNDVVFGEAGDDVVYGGTGNDIIFGGADNDYIDGESDEDVISGGAGNDTLFSGWGGGSFGDGIPDDLVQGDAGNDHLHAGEWGTAELRGGTGNDTYHVNSNSETNVVNDQGDAADVDAIVLEGAFTSESIWIYEDNLDGGGTDNDLVLEKIGDTETAKVIIFNWESNSSKIENINVPAGGNYATLPHANIRPLLNAMVSGQYLMPRKNQTAPADDFTTAALSGYWQ